FCQRKFGEQRRLMRLDPRRTLWIGTDLLPKLRELLHGHSPSSFCSFKCTSYSRSASAIALRYQPFQLPVLSPRHSSTAWRTGLNMNRTRKAPPLVTRNSFRLFRLEPESVSTSGRPRSGPRSSRTSTAASICSCCSSDNVDHQASNSSV